MNIFLRAERRIPAPAEAVYALSIDAQRFPAVFTGFGPIPGLGRITLHGEPAVGTTRDVEDNTGVVLHEHIDVLEPGRRHAYTLSGMQPPFAWLVRVGRADWTFTPAGKATDVVFSYTFELTRPVCVAAGVAVAARLYARRDATLPRRHGTRAGIRSSALMEKWILLGMAPVFAVCIAVEAWYWRKRRPEIYSWIDTISNGGLALMHQSADAVAWALVIGIYYLVYQHRLFDLPTSAWTIAGLFVAQDFFYYFFHRASHRIRWMWASHVTHHSSEQLNLSTAFRQSLTYPISGMWLFWLPLALLGFEPKNIIAVVAINLGFQFFVHTQVVGKLGWVEYIFNTPSHHRVHHARNPKYIDRNYAGVLIIWDKLFGSFVEEDPAVPCEYGIVGHVHSYNPIKLTFHEWIDMLRDATRTGGMRSALAQLFGPPERALSHTQRDPRF